MLRRTAPILVVLLATLCSAASASADSAFTSSSPKLEFGAVDVHFGGSPRQSLQFTNDTASPVLVKALTVTGPDASRFQIVGDGCSGQTIAMNPGSCTVEVSFEPGARVSRSATLELTDDEGVSTVTLSGEGITGQLAASPGPPNFAPLPYSRPNSEGEFNETVQTGIRNIGNAGTQAETVEITGPDASSFSIQYGNCEHNLLSAGSECGLGIEFQPTSPGAKHAQLVITNDSASGPLIVPLDGEGLFGAKISMSTYQALLGAVQLGSSVTQTVTLTNTGDYPLGVQQAFLLSGTPLMFPVLSDTCGRQIVYPGHSCAVTVEFRPTTVGQKDASILFITSSSLPLNVVGIDGSGFLPASSPPPVAKAATTPPPQSPLFRGHPAVDAHPISGGHKLDTGITVRCPVSVRVCDVESFIRVGDPAESSRGRSPGRAMFVLGSGRFHLRGGKSARVRVHLSPALVARLERGARLTGIIGLVLHSRGRVLATHTLPVALSGAHPGHRG